MGGGTIGRVARRVVIRTVIALLGLAGLFAGLAAAYVYYQQASGGWWVGVVTALVGIGAALGSWFIAALLSLLLEIADSLLALTRGSQADSLRSPSGDRSSELTAARSHMKERLATVTRADAKAPAAGEGEIKP